MHANAIVDLLQSVFENNLGANSTDGIGIENSGGQVHCHADGTACFAVCTTCQDDVLPPIPTHQPTFGGLSSSPPTPQSAATVPRVVWWVGCGILALVTGVVVMTWRWVRARRLSDSNPGEELPATLELRLQTGRNAFNYQPLAGSDTDSRGSVSETEKILPSSVMESFKISPAPIFVIGRNSMRIVVWSPGMAMAAPMFVEPLDCLVSGLPFVNESDGFRLHRSLEQIFEAPADRDNGRTFMLHLRARSERVVLLEMIANYFVTEDEPIIALTGREVDSELATLMASVSQAGSVKGGDDGRPASSALLELVADGESGWEVMQSSPEPIIVVDRTMRVRLWSLGMASAAPLLVDPMGRHLLELPFVNERSGQRVDCALREIFAAADADVGHDSSPQRIVIYLLTKDRPVLLEMTAHVEGTGSSMVIVVTGRRIELDLGCTSNDDHTHDGSRDRQIEGNALGDCGCECESVVSSLTTPSSLVSSLTTPSSLTREANETTTTTTTETEASEGSAARAVTRVVQNGLQAMQAIESEEQWDEIDDDELRREMARLTAYNALLESAVRNLRMSQSITDESQPIDKSESDHGDDGRQETMPILGPSPP